MSTGVTRDDAAHPVPVREARPTSSWTGCAEQRPGRAASTPAPVVRARATRRPASTCCSTAPSRCPAGSAATTSRPAAPTSAASYAGAMQAYLGDRVPQIHEQLDAAVTDRRGSSCCAADDFASSCGTGSRWRCTCWRACSSACRTPRRIDRPAGTAAGPRLAVRRAHPRAEQPGRRRRPGHRRAARAGRRDAAQAGDDRRRASIDRDALEPLVELQEDAVERVAKAADADPDGGQPTPRTRSATGWRTTTSPTAGTSRRRFVAGRARRRLAGPGRRRRVRTATLEGALRWLNYTVETELLMNEIHDATTRISTLVGAAKQYSQLDRAPYQVVDVHELLDSTLTMLGGKIGGRDGRQGVRPDAAARSPRYAGRAQPGVDQPDRQRASARWAGTAR